MSEVFDNAYADIYNIIYKDKDYAGECAIYANLIAKYGDGEIRKLFDLGCGTGRHVFAFRDLGFAASGVDRSPAMLAHARRAATERGEPGGFSEGDVRTFRSDEHFDATLMMFNVLGYMPGVEDVMQALATARHHTRVGGLFIADIWYGPAVLKDGPGNQFREIRHGNERIFRFASGRLDTRAQISEIDIRVLHVAEQNLVADTHETHRMRYFFPTEIELALCLNGFRLVALQGFPDVEKPVSENRWLAVVVAQAVENPAGVTA